MDTLAEEGRPEELETYLENEYTDLYEEEVADLKDEYPFFWEEETEEFTGPGRRMQSRVGTGDSKRSSACRIGAADRHVGRSC